MIKDITVDAEGKKLHYRNDPQLRRENVKLSLTQDHVNEFVKCSNDPIYFIENYCHVNDPNFGLKIITLRDYQKRLIQSVHDSKYNILNLPRQSGKSTTLSLYLVWQICFKNDTVSAILANKEKTAREIFGKVLDCFRLVPQFLKPGVKEYNKSSIQLDTGSKIIIAATSESGIRGYTINGTLLLDECAHLATPMFNHFYESVYPTISTAKDSKIVLVSTPNGLNHFYKIWQDAVNKKSGYIPFTINWNEVPGRDDAWRKKEISNIGEENFKQEYECSFVGGHKCLFNQTTLEKITYKLPIMKLYDGDLLVYQNPIKDRKYLLVCDISEGLGKDYHTMNIIDVTSFPFEQVAVYTNNTADLPVIPYIIEKIAKQFNDAMVLVENNGANKVVTNILFSTIEYENTYADDKEIGIRMTKTTKKAGIAKLKELIENQGIIINDFNTLKEMSNFIKKGESYKASAGNTDDIVMGLVLFSYFTNLEFFAEWSGNTGKNDKLKEMYDKKLQQMMEDTILPVIIETDNDLKDEDNWMSINEARKSNLSDYDPDMDLFEKRDDFND